MHTRNRIVVRAPPEVVFQLAADVLRWPEILDHYRYVRLLRHDGDGSVTVKMGASRDGIPVSWTSIQEVQPERGRILYHHIAGVTKAMEVVWSVRPGPEGAEVTIDHDLRSPRWWLRPALTSYLVGELFVKNIADKTLRGIKRRAEFGATRESG